MPRSRRNLQGIGCSALALALAACADGALGRLPTCGRANRPECLVGENASALRRRADGLAASQCQQRCHPQESLQWSSERRDDRPMNVECRKHDE